MDNSVIEKIYNDTFAGCTMFYRDTTVSEKLISKYRVTNHGEIKTTILKKIYEYF